MKNLNGEAFDPIEDSGAAFENSFRIQNRVLFFRLAFCLFVGAAVATALFIGAMKLWTVFFGR